MADQKHRRGKRGLECDSVAITSQMKSFRYTVVAVSWCLNVGRIFKTSLTTWANVLLRTILLIALILTEITSLEIAGGQPKQNNSVIEETTGLSPTTGKRSACVNGKTFLVFMLALYRRDFCTGGLLKMLLLDRLDRGEYGQNIDLCGGVYIMRGHSEHGPRLRWSAKRRKWSPFSLPIGARPSHPSRCVDLRQPTPRRWL